MLIKVIRLLVVTSCIIVTNIGYTKPVCPKSAVHCFSYIGLPTETIQGKPQGRYTKFMINGLLQPTAYCESAKMAPGINIYPETISQLNTRNNNMAFYICNSPSAGLTDCTVVLSVEFDVVKTDKGYELRNPSGAKVVSAVNFSRYISKFKSCDAPL